jgi:EEF1A N-terminal glycine/lysine methyltransferase
LKYHTYQPPEHYLTKTGTPIALHLVGHSPLEAHHLWNGSRVVASHFESHPDLVKDRTVLELGAGAGLPSLVAGALGARKVVVTDFPDPDLVENMWRNVRECTLLDEEEVRVVVNGCKFFFPSLFSFLLPFIFLLVVSGGN